MKIKSIPSALVLLLLATSAFAQAPLKIGRTQLNAGLGISGWGFPISIGFDQGFKENITLGGDISFSSYNNNHDAKSYNHRIIGLAANGNYHFGHVLEIPSVWDLYAGVNLGFYFWSSPSDYHGSGGSGLGLGLQAGLRYFFQPNLAAHLEFGGATVTSGGKLGISYLFH